MNPRRFRSAALVVAVLVLSSACTSAVAGRAVPGDIPPVPPPNPGPVQVPDGFDETPEVELQDGKPGGTFRVADYAPTSLDPADALSGPEVLVASNVFTQLTRVTTDLRVEPAVATSWKPDGTCREWTFDLSGSATFHNGERVTAQSFVDGWVKAAKGIAAGYQLDAVRGYPEVSKGLTAVSDDTLRVELSRPDCRFDLRVSHPAFSPVPKATLDPKRPIGNGPFTVESSDTTKVVLKRWEEYDLGPKANLDSVELLVADTPEVATQGADNGEYDWARATGPQLRQARDKYAPEGNWLAAERPGYTGLVPMVKNKPLTSPAARKAISYAIDREKLSATVTDGSAQPATGLISPSFTDTYRPGACEPCEYDPARAKQFAKQGKLTSKSTITLTYPDRPETKQWAEAIEAQVEQVLAVKIKLVPLPGREYFERQRGSKAAGLYRSAWLPDIPSAEDMLRPLLSADSVVSGNNAGRYASKKVDKLLDQASAAGDAAKRAGYLREAERVALTTDMAIIPLLGRKEYRFVNNEEFMNLRMDFFENPDLRVISTR